MEENQSPEGSSIACQDKNYLGGARADYTREVSWPLPTPDKELDPDREHAPSTLLQNIGCEEKLHAPTRLFDITHA